MRWLGLFTNKTFRKHLKLIFPHRDLIIQAFSGRGYHLHSVIGNFSSAFFHPHFPIRIFPSAFFHPHFIIRIFLSAIRHPPPSGPHFTETRYGIDHGALKWFDSYLSNSQKSILIIAAVAVLYRMVSQQRINLQITKTTKSRHSGYDEV